MNRRTITCAAVLAAVVLLFTPTVRTALSDDAKAELNLPKLEVWTLDNGLQVAYMRVTTAPVVAVEMWYRAGSKDEPPDRRGSAHMFEHMMFKGTKDVPPEEHARHLYRVGGYVNAFTTEDATAYVNVLPADYMDFAIQLEAERMRNLIFRKGMIDTEREVVKEEIRQRENNPIQKGLTEFFDIAFTKHPYAWTSGGTIADLDKTTPADLKKFYDTYYVPNNALLVVVGDVDKADVEASAKKWLGALKKGAEPPRPADASPEPEQTKMRERVVDPSMIGLILAGYHIPEAAHEDVYALQVLSLILGAGDSSRLNERLVLNDKIALQAGSSALIREDPGLFALIGAYDTSDKRELVKAALLDEVAKVQKAAPTDREVRKAKNQLQAGFVFGLESASGLAQQIGSSWILTGDSTQFLRDLDAFEKITAADVQAVAKKYLQKDNLTLVIIPIRKAE